MTAAIKKLSFDRRIFTALMGAAIFYVNSDVLASLSTAICTSEIAIYSEASEAAAKSSDTKGADGAAASWATGAFWYMKKGTFLASIAA